MIYREYRPAPALGELVECYWSLRGHVRGPGPGRHRVLPDGCVDLLFPLASGAESGGPASPVPYVVGAMPRAAVVPHAGSVHAWGVRFRPGGAPAFLRPPATELTGRAPELSHFWGSGAGALRERLLQGPHDRARVSALDQALIARMRPGRTDPMVMETRGALQASNGNLEITELARQAGLSTRQLERRYARSVGLAPKLLAQILRFRAGVEALAREPTLEKGRLALRLGYYDQAHFGREFKELAGVPPGTYLEERRGVAFVQADPPPGAQVEPREERIP